MAEIELQFSTPEYGWLTVELTTALGSRKFVASDVPGDSIEMLTNAIARWYDGVPDSSVNWFFEPDEKEWVISRRGNLVQLGVRYWSVSAGSAVGSDLFSLEGSASGICVPIWRALRKLAADPAWSGPSSDEIWIWPFPETALAELTQRVQAPK